jgi:hypothetical protein
VERCELDPSGSGKEPVAGVYEDANEASGSIRGGVFLDLLSDLISQEGLISL